jgi:adenylylsulfate kinase
MHDSKRRSLMKAMSWRCFAVIITSAVGYMFTESAAFAVSIGVADSLLKVFAYYLHERAWVSVPEPRPEPSTYAPGPKVRPAPIVAKT